MKNELKKIILSNSFLTRLSQYFYKIRLKKNHQVRFGNKSFVGLSVVFEGNNFIGRTSSITSSRIGYASYLAANTHISQTKIGRFCSIGPNVTLIFGKHPADKFVSTHPTFFSPSKRVGFSFTKIDLFEEFSPPIDSEGKYSIIIGNDVWVGANACIMDGIKIGDGAVIAANALVNKNVPPYTIVGGVPAKIIKKRFSDDHIKFLLDLKWWEKPKTWIAENAKYFTDIVQLHNRYSDD